MKITLTTLLSFLIISISFAQLTNIKRIEIEDTKTLTILDYIPFGNLGIIEMSYDKNKDKEDKKNSVYTYTKYNSNLEKAEVLDLKRPKKYYGAESTHTAQHLFKMYYNKKGEYILYKIDIKTMVAKPSTGIFPAKLNVYKIEATGNHVYIFGKIKHRPFLLIKNTSNGMERIVKLPLLSKDKNNYLSFTKNEKSGEVFLFLKDEIADKSVVKMYAFKEDKTVSEVILPNTDGKYLDDASASKTNDGSYIITGTYKLYDKGPHSIGMYVIKVTDNKISYKRFINYLDINNFTSHLSQRKQDKIEKKRDKKADKGKDLAINYRIAAHDIIEDNGTYILVGEAYYPTYRKECTTTTVNGTTTTTCRSVFDGYRYTHYFAYAFDKDGKTLWSNSEPLHIAYKPYSVVRFCSLNLKAQVLSVVYASSFDITTTTFQDGVKLNSTKATVIETSDAADDVKLSSANSSYWYDNYYIISGWQKIKDANKEKRNVYYLNKVQYTP